MLSKKKETSYYSRLREVWQQKSQKKQYQKWTLMCMVKTKPDSVSHNILMIFSRSLGGKQELINLLHSCFLLYLQHNM